MEAGGRGMTEAKTGGLWPQPRDTWSPGRPQELREVDRLSLRPRRECGPVTLEFQPRATDLRLRPPGQ